MSLPSRNKIAAQLIKAEMLGDQERVKQLKQEMIDLEKKNESQVHSASKDRELFRDDRDKVRNDRLARSTGMKAGHTSKINKFLNSSSSIGQMFEQEKRLTAADEAKMFVKTSTKFSRDDMETKYFSTEIDNSGEIMSKIKKTRIDNSHEMKATSPNRVDERCAICKQTLPRHLVIDEKRCVYLHLPRGKPLLRLTSDVIISNCDHSIGNSFVSIKSEAQVECEEYINELRTMWQSLGFRCVFMETYFRDKRPQRGDQISGGNHFQVHCIPIKEKHFELARMNFKQALLDCEKEWSLNKKLIVTEGRRIQRLLPRGLSYFWVCFDKIDNGFGHVIESESEFSRSFGLEILSNLISRDSKHAKHSEKDFSSKEVFDRSRDFKLQFMRHREQLDCKASG